MRRLPYLLPICLVLCGCPKKTPAPAAVGASETKTGALPQPTETATTTAKTTGTPDPKSKPKPKPKPKVFPVRSRAKWLENAISYVSFPRPNRTTMVLFFHGDDDDDVIEIKLVPRGQALTVELDETPLSAPGLTAATAKGHAVWKLLARRLAERHRGYTGQSPHGIPTEVRVEPNTPIEVTREALRIAAASFPDDAYTKPKRLPLTYALLMPKRAGYRPPTRTPRIGGQPPPERPIIVPKIGGRKGKPTYQVRTRTEWLTQASGFAKQSGSQKVAILFFCPSLQREGPGTPRIDMNVLRVKLLNQGGKVVVRCGRNDLNKPGELAASNSAGHTVWTAFQKQVTRHKHGYKGSSPHGLPVRIDVDPGVPVSVTEEALKIAAAVYSDGAFAKPELPPLQRAVLKSKR